MRILHVLDHSLPVSDGYSYRSHAILREQRRLGWDVRALTGPKHEGQNGHSDTVDDIVYARTAPATRSPRSSIVAQMSVIRRLRSRIRESIARDRPDVIHAHSPCLDALAAFGLGVPVVYELRSSWEDAAVSNGTTTEGSPRYRASRALESVVLRRSAAVTTICDGLRDDVVARIGSESSVTVVPNAVDVAAFGAGAAVDAVAARSARGLDDRLVLGFIGSFFAWEGLSVLLDALPAILARRRDVRVLLVGRGNEDAALRGKVASMGLQDAVHFTGAVPHAEVARLYAAIDVLVYPRLPMRLTDMVTPLKPLEAMALGKALVASDVGGHRELIRDGETGLLFKAGNPEALADSVLRLLSDDALRTRCQRLGIEFVRRERTWERVVPKYERVYAGALGAAT